MIKQSIMETTVIHLINRCDVIDIAQNSPPRVKIPTLTIIVDQNYDPPNKNSSILYTRFPSGKCPREWRKNETQTSNI